MKAMLFYGLVVFINKSYIKTYYELITFFSIQLITFYLAAVKYEFKRTPRRASFNDARDQCKAMGGELLTANMKFRGKKYDGYDDEGYDKPTKDYKLRRK